MVERKKRLRWHSYTLMVGTLLALLLSWGIAQLYDWLNLEPKPETRAFKVVVWAVILHLVMLLIWTSYVLEDILKSEKDKLYQRLATILLFLPYLPLVLLMGWKVTESVSAYWERQRLMEEVGSYSYRPWPENLEALWSGPASDSLEVLLKLPDRKRGRKLYLTEAGEAYAILREAQLKELRFCPDDQLIVLPSIRRMPSSQDAQRVLMPLPITKWRYQALNSLVNDELVVLDSLGSQWNDTIPGFQDFLVRASFRKPPAFEDEYGNYWFMIWEQTATVSPSNLYVVSYKNQTRQVFYVPLNEEHRAAFSANRIRGLYATGRNAYVLGASGYLYFRLPTAQ